MMFKSLFLSVACLAFVTHPAHCNILSDIVTASWDILSDIKSVTGDMIKAKASSLVQATAQSGNTLAMGSGLTAEALEKLTYDTTNSIANGLVSYGRLLSRLGTGVVEDKLDASPYAGLGSMVTNLDRVPRRIFKSTDCGSGSRSRCGYEIVYTPRLYRGPRGGIRIE